MAIETLPGGIPIRQIAQEAYKHIKYEVLTTSADRIITGAPLEWDTGARQTYARARRDGATRIVIPGHLVHLDALGAGIGAEQLDLLETEEGIENPTQGSVLTLAKSVESGHQGDLLKTGLEKIIPIFEDHGMKILTYVRPQDVERYGLNRADNFKFGRSLLTEIKNGRGIIIFPEGSVEAGRRVLPRQEYVPTESPLEAFGIRERIWTAARDRGIIEEEVNGLQTFNGADIRQLHDSVARNGRQAAFVPMMVNGIYRLIRPTDAIDQEQREQKKPARGNETDETVVFQDKNIITPRGFASVFAPFDLGIVNLRIGRTITTEEINDELGGNYSDEELGDFFGRRVAHLYPKELQGVYRGRTTA